MSNRSSLGVPSFVFTVLLLSSISLSACGKEDPVILPEGVQILTGTVLPTDISLLRRGTHLFTIGDENVYFLESTGVSLRKYEHKRVVLQGEVSANIDNTYLPVLTVDTILNVLEQAMKDWQLRSLELSLALPESWGGSIETGHSQFIPLGADQAVITLMRLEDENDEEEELDYLSVPIVLGSIRATKIIDDDTGNEIIRVPRPNGFIQISYTALEHPHASQWHEDWEVMLTSLVFNSTDRPTPVASSGSVSGSPCGGPAGILCPAGFYCDVVNLQENIGICKGL